MGKATHVLNDDIPIDYRNDPKILSGLAKYNPKDVEKRNVALKKIKQQLSQVEHKASV